jgi:hypothetical protein
MKARSETTFPGTRQHFRRAFRAAMAGACLLPCLARLSVPTMAEDGHALADTRIGIEGTCRFVWDGPALEIAPVEEKAPLVLRIAYVERTNVAAVYELRFIGERAGHFDLCDFLRRADGQPLLGLPPLPVRVVELLPADHDGSLAELTGPAIPRFWRYRGTLWLLTAVWAIPLAVAILRRSLRRNRRAIAAEMAQPTFADQLRPLVAAALAGSLSDAEQAHLEMLLIAYWRDRLELRGLTPRASLQRMRDHSQAGQLLHQLERWLHQRAPAAAVDVAAILAPYRHDPVIDETDLPPRREKPEEESSG